MSTPIKQNRIDRIRYFQESISVIRGSQEATLLLNDTLWGSSHLLNECSQQLWQLRNILVKRRRATVCERALDRTIEKVNELFRDCDLESYHSEYDDLDDRIRITLELSCEYPRKWK